MQAAHGEGRYAQTKRQRNHFCGRWMVYVPSYSRTSGQEDEKERCNQLHEGAGPKMKAFKLRYEHHFRLLFSDLLAQIQLFSAFCSLDVLWHCAFCLLTLRLCVARGHLSWKSRDANWLCDIVSHPEHLELFATMPNSLKIGKFKCSKYFLQKLFRSIKLTPP